MKSEYDLSTMKSRPNPYTSKLKVVEKIAMAGDAATNTSLAGDYQLLDKPARIIAEGTRLYLQSELFGSRRMELFAESKSTFFLTARDMTVRFGHGADGAIVGFSLLSGTNTYAATKSPQKESRS